MSTKQKWPPHPPAAFWISPKGVLVYGQTHLEAIRQHPKMFGLLAAPDSTGATRAAFDTAYARGWAKVNYQSGRFLVLMERPYGATLAALQGAILRWRVSLGTVYVEFLDDTNPDESAISDFLESKFPGAWGINPPARSRARAVK